MPPLAPRESAAHRVERGGRGLYIGHTITPSPTSTQSAPFISHSPYNVPSPSRCEGNGSISKMRGAFDPGSASIGQIESIGWLLRFIRCASRHTTRMSLSRALTRNHTLTPRGPDTNVGGVARQCTRVRGTLASEGSKRAETRPDGPPTSSATAPPLAVCSLDHARARLSEHTVRGITRTGPRLVAPALLVSLGGWRFRLPA